MNRRDVDLLDPAFHVDPHPAYTWMRDNEPVYRDRHNRLWGIATHADVLDVERRSTVFSSAHGYRAAPIAGEDSIIALDDPRHRQQRSLVSRRFTPRAATRQRHHLERLVAELTAGALQTGMLDVVNQLAAPLPAIMITDELGFGQHRWPEVASWSQRLAHHDSIQPGSDLDIVGRHAFDDYIAAVDQLAANPNPDRPDALIPTWLRSTIDNEPLTYRTVLFETMLFLVGGAETTRTALIHGLHAFAQNPDQWERLHHQPELIDTAVDEIVRYVTPLSNMSTTQLRQTSDGT